MTVRASVDAGWVRVAALAALPDDALTRAHLPDGRALCLARRGGEVWALDDRCPHAEFPLSEGELLADGSVQCSWHGARFDARTGLLLAAPPHAPDCAAASAHDVLILHGDVHVRPRRAAPAR